MERKRHHVSFSYPDRPAIMPCDDVDFARVLHDWGANENPREGLSVAVQLERGLEALQLPSVSVAADGDGQYPEPALTRQPVNDRVCQQDHAGARPEGRQATADGGGNRVVQAHPLKQDLHRRALAARNHEAVERFQVLGKPHEASPGARRLERAYVLAERPLQGQHPDQR